MEHKYLLLYGDKKEEDNILIPFMFKNYQKIPLGWIEKDKELIENIISQKVDEGIEQFVFWGLEVGWSEVIKKVKKQYSKVKIKIICNTSDALLYYDYERENFFELLSLSKKGLVDNIAFLQKGMYETYKKLGYKSSYILENISLKKNKIKFRDNIGKSVGIYQLNYTWDKNIYNQLSIGKFLDKMTIRYNPLDKKMEEFLKIMKINSKKDPIKEMDAYNIAEIISKNIVNVSCDFTDYVHPIALISMECGIPCIIGDTSCLFDTEKLQEYLVVHSEDNPIKISNKIMKAINNSEEIIQEYMKWKTDYNQRSEESIISFLNK